MKNGSIQLEHRSTMGDIDEVPTILDQKTTRRLLWKLDLFILPLISITYFLASVVSHHEKGQKLLLENIMS